MTALSFTPEFLAKFDQLEPLGAGGMGTVYRGIQRSLERPVAIKFLSRQLLDDEYLARFRAEARLAGQVFHTNLVAVIEFGMMSDIPFIVFELVEGSSLREHVKRAGRLPLAESLEIVRQAAEGLAVAHGIGIVHRDIKPENILVGPKGVKVADFGVAKNASSGASQKTRSGVIMGTPAYMAPEQAREQEVTPATDIYALGVVLYELVGGALPYQKSSTLELLQAIVSEPPPPLGDEVPAPVADLVNRMLAKEPSARPASMAECAQELVQVAAQVGTRPLLSGAVRAPVTASPGATNATRPVTIPSSAGRHQTVVTRPTGKLATVAAPAAPRSRMAAGVGLAALLVLGAWAGFARFAHPHSRPHQPAVADPKSPGGIPPILRPPQGPESLATTGHDEAMAQLCELGGAQLPLCRAWTLLAQQDVVGAVRTVLEPRYVGSLGSLATGVAPLNLSEADRKERFRDVNVRLARFTERVVGDLFARPRARAVAEADQLALLASRTPVAELCTGIADLVSGGARLATADQHLAAFERGLLAKRAMLPARYVLGVLEALSLAVALPAGWVADGELTRRAETARAECEAYLKLWGRGELRPVASALAIELARARGLAVDPCTDLRHLDPTLRARFCPRLQALTRLAVSHIAAGAPGSALAPDPAY